LSQATVIVPTHRAADRIEPLLHSLRSQSVGHQLLVVDNASTDGTADVLARYPEAQTLRLERNLGFGAAANLAAQRAEGDVLVLLNDDCVCRPEFVERISASLDPSAGVVMGAGVLLDERDERLIDSAGIELDQTLLVYDYLNGEAVAGLSEGTPDPIGPCGAAAAFDRQAFLEAGGFDQALFAYWEDVDLVLRLRRAGGSCRLASLARATHTHSATLGSGSSAKNALVGFGRGYVLRKWGVMSPRRAAGVLARDGVICAGQAVFDRTISGVSGRFRGWRASSRTFPYPDDLLRDSPATRLGENLRRRLWRRRRLKGVE
jgi:GT2 family glycosyltransferase